MISKYVINLPSREDRRSEMEEQLRRVGWDAQFSHAPRPTDNGGFPSIGALGCFLSHLTTLKRGLQDRKHVLVMEDDLDFNPGFTSLWDEIFGRLQFLDWNMFYPAHYLTNQADGLLQVAPDLGIRCTHFYVIHKNTVPVFIDGLETIMSRPGGHPLGGPMHVDGAYCTIREQNPQLKTFVFSPTMGYQRSSRTDIGDTHWIERLPMGRPIASSLRKLKRKLNTPGKLQ